MVAQADRVPRVLLPVREQAGTGYQTMMNEVLRRFVSAPVEKPLTESSLRRIIREELPKFAPSKQRDAKERAA